MKFRDEEPELSVGDVVKLHPEALCLTWTSGIHDVVMEVLVVEPYDSAYLSDYHCAWVKLIEPGHTFSSMVHNRRRGGTEARIWIGWLKKDEFLTAARRANDIPTT